MKKILIIVIIPLILITGCKKDTKINQFKLEYEALNNQKTSSGKNYPVVEIDDDNKMFYATINDLEDVFENKKSAVIYFGYPECPWCRNAVPNLIKASKKTALDKIYYVNVHDMRSTYIYQDNQLIKTKEGTKEYYQILKWLDPILEKYVITDTDLNKHEVGEKRLYVPIVVFIKDGTIIGYHLDTLESQIDPYIPLNDDEKKELQNKYETLIHKVLGDVCDENC